MPVALRCNDGLGLVAGEEMMEQIYRTPGAPSDAEQLDTARKLVIEHRRASISLVQRHMRIGYNAAARLMEELEREGTVSPAQNTTGVRSVLKLRDA